MTVIGSDVLIIAGRMILDQHSFDVTVWIDIGIHLVSGCFFFFQAEDGIRDLVRSRGLGDVYKRQGHRK